MGLSFILYLLAVIFVLIGIAGIILPALPGIPLVFIGLLLAAWADGFAHVGWPTLVALGVLTLLSLLVDVLATVVGAQRVGASRKALWGTFVGSIVRSTWRSAPCAVKLYGIPVRRWIRKPANAGWLAKWQWT